jgi:hypothetical protein
MCPAPSARPPFLGARPAFLHGLAGSVRAARRPTACWLGLRGQVFDIRALPRLVGSVPFPAGPSMLHFHPKLSGTLLVASNSGVFTMASTQGGRFNQTHQVIAMPAPPPPRWGSEHPRLKWSCQLCSGPVSCPCYPSCEASGSSANKVQGSRRNEVYLTCRGAGRFLAAGETRTI